LKNQELFSFCFFYTTKPRRLHHADGGVFNIL